MPSGGKRKGAGRPKGATQICKNGAREALAEACRKRTPDILKTLLDVMENASSDAARLQAVTIMLDRGYGKPFRAPQPLLDEPTDQLEELLQDIQSRNSSSPIRSTENIASDAS